MDEWEGGTIRKNVHSREKAKRPHHPNSVI
jgi:hypothetical protein